MVAEGIRKIATLLHLLENGSLEVGDTLFWDEPESNLNPKLIKDVAAAIYFLCQNGIQVVIGTHSYFLLKEIDLISRSRKEDVPITFIGLSKSDGCVSVSNKAKSFRICLQLSHWMKNWRSMTANNRFTIKHREIDFEAVDRRNGG